MELRAKFCRDEDWTAEFAATAIFEEYNNNVDRMKFSSLKALINDVTILTETQTKKD